ncbi:hypothetical protein PAXRUDRAFT_168415, partial [Paxillus rubicundulus Ve08.2h10]
LCLQYFRSPLVFFNLHSTPLVVPGVSPSSLHSGRIIGCFPELHHSSGPRQLFTANEGNQVFGSVSHRSCIQCAFTTFNIRSRGT